MELERIARPEFLRTAVTLAGWLAGHVHAAHANLYQLIFVAAVHSVFEDRPLRVHYVGCSATEQEAGTMRTDAASRGIAVFSTKALSQSFEFTLYVRDDGVAFAHYRDPDLGDSLVVEFVAD